MRDRARPLGLRQQGTWNKADREQYNIVRERYTSDLSDEEYALIEPLLPQPKRRGRKPTPARTILNAIFLSRALRLSLALYAKGLSALHDRAKSIYQLRDSGILIQIICLLVQTRASKPGGKRRRPP